jgi:hypothetical protein
MTYQTVTDSNFKITDGAHWSRLEGMEPYCSVLAPGKMNEFDHQFIGISSISGIIDVVHNHVLKINRNHQINVNDIEGIIDVVIDLYL